MPLVIVQPCHFPKSVDEIALEFKDEAVRQVIDRGHPFVDLAKRLGIPEGVLYTWVSKFKKADAPLAADLKAMQAEVAKLKAELRRSAIS